MRGETVWYSLRSKIVIDHNTSQEYLSNRTYSISQCCELGGEFGFRVDLLHLARKAAQYPIYLQGI